MKRGNNNRASDRRFRVEWRRWRGRHKRWIEEGIICLHLEIYWSDAP